MLKANQEIKLKTVEISLYLHSTEDFDRIIDIICDNLKIPIEKKAETKLTGTFNNEIKRITFILKKSECSIFLKNLTDKMIQEYIDGFEFIDGKKFIKVVGRGSAKAFIVKKSGTVSGKYGGFEEGDILKANTWTAPAKNGARGNVLKGNYKIKWTGPLYFN